MIYLWESPDNYPEKLVGEYDRQRSPDRFLMQEGTPVEMGDTYVEFEAKASWVRKFDALATNAMVPLVSPRIQEVLLRLAPDQVQFVPAHITTRDEEISGYVYVVATKQVVGLDHEASEYSYIADTTAIMGFEKIRYKEDCLGELHIARDAEYLPHILISKTLRDALEDLHVGGLGLYRPEDMWI